MIWRKHARTGTKQMRARSAMRHFEGRVREIGERPHRQFRPLCAIPGSIKVYEEERIPIGEDKREIMGTVRSFFSGKPISRVMGINSIALPVTRYFVETLTIIARVPIDKLTEVFEA